MFQTQQLSKKNDLKNLIPKDKILIRYTNGLMYFLEVIRTDNEYVVCKIPNMKCLQEIYLSIEGRYSDYVDYIIKILN